MYVRILEKAILSLEILESTTIYQKFHIKVNSSLNSFSFFFKESSHDNYYKVMSCGDELGPNLTCFNLTIAVLSIF